ncbi:restriction endonuclease subunit S [Paenibacillus rigui]|uniref:Type I restriction modification DNA specificity domain-containing protein n=1 Tax=Paenibacillus rigui TaxID=554312 RepID=A0A229URC6_9BACL|nr:restriction endonuclease subunit S [Paenibacillus rigui]OXM85801.1 hypothetical protein CF651_11220 [Paenibacillus rigui]
MTRSILKLSEVIKIHHGWPFKSEYFSEEQNGNPVVVNIGNFRYDGGFRFETTKIKEYTGQYPKEYELIPSDILLVMTCQTAGGEILGIPGRIPDDGRKYLHNQRLGKVEVLRSDLIDKSYLYWLFLSKDFNNFLFQSASGTKILHTAPTRIEEYTTSFPKIEVQKQIGNILDSLNAKIEINRRMIETLEQMALTLYKHWFVEFGPFQEEEFHEIEEVGTIPACFEVTNIGSAVKVLGGGTPSTKVNEYWENGEINWFSPTDLTSSKTLFVNKSAKKITEMGLNESSAKMFPAYSVMMTSRATIGVIAINQEPAATNQGFIILIPNERYSAWYLFLWLKFNMEKIRSISNGSTFLEVNRSNFKALPILNSERVQEFNKKVEPLFAQIKLLTNEIETLMNTRDYLLPRLLSGEIELKAAEEQVEEVLSVG